MSSLTDTLAHRTTPSRTSGSPAKSRAQSITCRGGLGGECQEERGVAVYFTGVLRTPQPHLVGAEMTTVEVKTEAERNEGPDSRSQSPGMDIPPEQEGFFNLISHVQGTRMDEQRCNIQIVSKSDAGSTGLEDRSPDSPPPEMNKLMDMLAHSQSRRLDDQRADFTYVPGCQKTDNNGTVTPKK